MGAVTAEEIASLQREFDWVLTTEVDNVTKELKAAVTVSTVIFPFKVHLRLFFVSLKECANKFPIKVGDLNTEKADYPSSDKFVLASGDQVKVIVTLTGDAISGADSNLKLPRPHTKDARSPQHYGAGGSALEAPAGPGRRQPPPAGDGAALHAARAAPVQLG